MSKKIVFHKKIEERHQIHDSSDAVHNYVGLMTVAEEFEDRAS